MSYTDLSAGSRAKVTPAARRLAEKRGIELESLAPGADGVVGLREVDAVEPSNGDAVPTGTGPTDMRVAIAAAMARSNRDIAHYYVGSRMDMMPLMMRLAEVNQDRPVERRLLYVAPLIRAVATALEKPPDVNGLYENGSFTPSQDVHLGMAIATRKGGLIIPAILNANKLDVDMTMVRLSDLITRSRASGLRSSEFSMGTVTMTKLGDDTADFVIPIIFHPQVAMIGCGQIGERPMVHDGGVVPWQTIDVTLAGDHRVSDGRTGAKFLFHLSTLLQKPEAL